MMCHVGQLDPDQLAALRRLRAAFGPIEILEVIDHRDDQDQTATRRGPSDQEGSEDQPSPEPCPAERRYSTRRTWRGSRRTSS
jgi:hypothetical protein